MIQSKKQRIISIVVFFIYLAFLAWLVLFKFATNISDVPHIHAINLIPFYYDRETSIHLKEVLYNIIVFVPLGVYLQILLEKKKLTFKFLTVLLASFLFEIVQFIFAIGASDVTDLITNTFGGALGILLCILMNKLFARKAVSIINTVGIIIEAAGIGLLTLLLISNS